MDVLCYPSGRSLMCGHSEKGPVQYQKIGRALKIGNCEELIVCFVVRNGKKIANLVPSSV